MAGGRLHKDKDLKNTKSLDPNLRDEGAGFFSTLYTAGSNLGTDALQEIAYIAQAVARPIDTGEAILRVVAGYAQKGLPDSWEAYLPEDWQTNKMYANAINDYYAEKYGSLEKAADSFAEKPVSVALDVFAVKAVISAVARQAAKKAAVTTKLATTAEGTVLQGELAARAAAESAIAKETAGTVERVVKHEGKLVFDRELGAYVPESSVGQAARSADEIAIAQETAAPIIADVVEKTPTVKPAVLADDIDNLSPPEYWDALMLREEARRAQLSPELRALEDSILQERIELGTDFTWVGSTTTAEEAVLRLAAAKAKPTTAVDLTGSRAADGSLKVATQADAAKLLRDEQAMTAATRTQEAFPGELAQAKLAANADLPYGSPDAINTAVSKPIISEAEQLAKLTDDLHGIKDEMVKLEAEYNKITPEDGGPAWLVERGYELEGRLDNLADGLDSAHKAKVAEIAALETRIADKAKLARDEKAMKDNASMSAEALQMENAMQPELFSQGSAAAYEQAQAARIANEVRSAAEFSKTGNTGMMGVTLPESRLATRQPKYVDNTPVSKFTPVSVPKPIYSSSRGWKKPEIDDYKAAALVGQRISSATQANTELPAFDNEAFDIPILGNDVVTNPDYTKPEAPIVPEVKVQELRPGWRQGNTYENDDGNFWSADFDHEHWNTPAGVNEAISIWGRPMGSRHSWETPAAIKSQYTNRQPADWSWMNQMTRNKR